jgi:alkylation response protein AidB-like acyl-CoA dehydrogenase
MGALPGRPGGLDIDRSCQPVVDQMFDDASAPDNNPGRNTIGLGMAAPTILAHGTPAQKERFLRPLWTGEEIWCQLFSEPGAGSDLAGIATRAVRHSDEWIVNGQKVWTSGAHYAHFAIVIARTAPERPKHAGLTYFLCDMRDPGVEVRPCVRSQVRPSRPVWRPSTPQGSGRSTMPTFRSPPPSQRRFAAMPRCAQRKKQSSFTGRSA